MVRILRNVGGVPGLHVALDAFTESAEKRLFESIQLHPYEYEVGQRSGLPSGPTSWPTDVFRLCNAVTDCGLWPGYFTPDYCLSLTYPPKAGFRDHFDSRYRWGETVVGATLGQGGTIYFVPGDAATKAKGPPPPPPTSTSNAPNEHDAINVRVKNYPSSGGFAVEIDLPRRSIYVMSGDSRIRWKHGMRNQRPTLTPPSWNPHNLRRSLTLRATKCYSDVALEEALRQSPNEALEARLAAQRKYRPEHGGGRIDDDEIEALRSKARFLLDSMAAGALPVQERFPREELTFALPPEAAAAADASRKSASSALAAAVSSDGPSDTFPGRGHRLGGIRESDTAEDDQVRRAIALSLGSGKDNVTEEDDEIKRAIAISLSGEGNLEGASSAPERRSRCLATGGSANDPLVLDSDDDDDGTTQVGPKRIRVD